MIPDILEPGLKVVFCGTAMSRKAEANGVYYTGPGNKFWPTLVKIGFLPAGFSPHDFKELPAYGIGLTNLVNACSGRDHEIPRNAFDVEALKAKVRRYRPGLLAFNGKRAAREVLGQKCGYGLQEEHLDGTPVFVLPSTSGAASGFWDEAFWRELFYRMTEDYGRDGSHR